MTEEARWAARKYLLLDRMDAATRALNAFPDDPTHVELERVIDDAIAILQGLPPPSSLPPPAPPWGYPKPPSAPSPTALDSVGAPPSPSDPEKP